MFKTQATQYRSTSSMQHSWISREAILQGIVLLVFLLYYTIPGTRQCNVALGLVGIRLQ